MPNPFSDFWDFVIGNTDDHDRLGSGKYLLVALFLALVVASIVIAIRNWREIPPNAQGRTLRPGSFACWWGECGSKG